MASKLFPSLAATAFAAMLFNFFLKRRSRGINGGEANNNAAANDGTAGGDSGTRTSTEVPEMATSSEANKDAAANDGTARGDSGTHTSTEVPDMATSSGCDYEIFLSFRGPDTRAGFTDFLYTSLTDARIRAFKDDEDLRIGEEFASELLQAIKQSKISIPIFSKGYASSVWCLKELVQMVDCQKTRGQKIMPIFYDVAPLEVRHQTGGYGEAFLSHENKKRYDEETMSEWKAALEEVSFLNGWDLHNMPNRREGKFAKELIQEVFNELNKAYVEVPDCLVSVDCHVNKIKEMIGTGTSETRIVGIHGMGGIGKTTIAKIIYNQLSSNFEDCCFLSNIRETSNREGIECLQNRLISDILKKKCTDIRNIDDGNKIIKDRLSAKKVLLLLDDVDHKRHMDALAGKHDWFGKGSKVIITSRNKDVLDVPKVDCIYEVNAMDSDQSLQLFCKHAFRRDDPLNEFINQSNRVIEIAGGLPLALEVIGSLLFGKNKEMWDATLEKLANVPLVDVQGQLKISYDALDDGEKDIFRDIACLFIGHDKDILIHFWDALNLYPKVAMVVLQNKSLIKITEDNEVWMHDQLRDLGKEMVRQDSKRKIEKQSRVWDPKEAFDLLRRHEGKKVEALRLKFDREQQYRVTYEEFKKLSNLRFLEVGGSMENFRAEERLLWHESPSNVSPTNDNSDLLPQLRWLSWCDIPRTFNITKFSMENVVILDLSGSEITDEWKGWNHMKVMRNLKVLDLSGCYFLQRLPDSIGNFESLIELNISNNMGIKELPESIGKLKNLKKVKMCRCVISKIPDAFWTIEKLEEIHFSINSIVEPGMCIHVEIGNGIYKNQSLRILRLGDAAIYALPPSLPESLTNLYLDKLYISTFPNVSNLTNLKELELIYGRPDSDEESDGLVEYPMTSDYVTTSLTDLSFPPQLKSLRLRRPNLHRLPGLPSSLSSLDLGNCKSLYSMENLSNLKNLSSLKIWDAAITEIQGLGCLDNLRDLRLSFLRQVKILPDLSNLNKLTSLYVSDCGNLVEIQGELPQSLEKLMIYFCKSLQNLPDLSSLMGKQEVEIQYCDKLNAEAILGYVQLRKNRKDLQLVCLEQLLILPDLSNSNELRLLNINSCGNLVEIQGELPQSLESLVISSCESLQKLPYLSSSMRLRKVSIYNCGNPVEIQGELPRSLEELKISSCKSLQKLPNMSSLMGLREVSILECGNLVDIQGELPQSLEELKIDSCESLQKLPNLSSSMRLREVCIYNCGNLVEILGELPQSLQKLKISFCKSLQKLPNMSSLMGLREVSIRECGNLVDIQGELPQSLETLKIDYCESLQELPNLSSFKRLRMVIINRCRKLNVEAISSFCSEKSIFFEGEDNESKGEEDEFESEPEGEDNKSESKSEGEEDEFESEPEGEDDKSESKSEGEDEE